MPIITPPISIFRKEAHVLPLLLAVGFTLRLFCILFFEYGVFSDAAEFRELAVNLGTGKGFSLNGSPTAYRMPGYPLFLAPLYVLFNSDIAVKIVQAMVELATGVVAYMIARKHIGKREACTTLALWVLLPVSILQPLVLMSEGLFTLLLMLLLLGMTGNLSFRRTVTAGSLCALAALVKPYMVLFPAVFIIWQCMQKYHLKKIIVHSILFTWCTVLFFTPWVVRNSRVLGTAVINTNGGQNLYIGNSPEADGSFFDIPAAAYPASADEVTTDRHFRSKAISHMKGDPAALLRTIPKKVAYLFSLESSSAAFLYEKGRVPADISFKEAIRATPLPLLVLFNVPYIFIVLGSVFALLLLTRQFSILRAVAAITLFWIAVHGIFFGAARFHYPLLPLFSIASATLLHNQRAVTSASHSVHIAASAAALLMCGLWASELIIVFTQ